MTLRRVLVIYTGGTIGMIASERGYVPVAGALERQLREMPRFHVAGRADLTLPASPLGPGCTYVIREFSPPLDSSNVGVPEWVLLASMLRDAWQDFDAFVVLHGTDTMAYTASALSFMLDGQDKSVVFTGSQVPLTHLRNDAIDNLLGALILAGHYDLPEVTLYFRDRLFRGNRVQKVDASGFDAFDSGNHPPLATVGIDIDVTWERVRRPTGPLVVREITEACVAAVRLYPGMTATLLDRFLQPPLHGLVLETYGAGNAPDNRPDFHRVLRRAHEDGIVLVNVTQCHRGTVSVAYAAGRALADLGVVPGADMTPEAALTKLAWLLSVQPDIAEVRRLMAEDLRGELTVSGRGLRGVNRFRLGTPS